MTYQEALAEERKVGVSRCSDAAVMAGFCQDSIKYIMGAVGPRQVWDGAQKAGLTFKQLVALCSTDPDKVEALQWS